MSDVELPRRLLFGEVADAYDRSRPTYPDALIDDLVAWAGPDRAALEVGAGTGKATRLLAARGVSVLGIEPSAEMAAVARRTCEPYGNVEIVESDFERWEPSGRAFELVYAAQAWHWVDQETGYAHARAALRAGGRLAAFWNRPAWGRSELRSALSAVYHRIVPDQSGEDGSMHPDVTEVAGTDDFWIEAIAGTPGLAEPATRTYPWTLEYTPSAYVEFLGTLSATRLLEPDRRRALLDAVRAVIVDHGGVLPMPMQTTVALAHAV